LSNEKVNSNNAMPSPDALFERMLEKIRENVEMLFVFFVIRIE